MENEQLLRILELALMLLVAVMLGRTKLPSLVPLLRRYRESLTSRESSKTPNPCTNSPANAVKKLQLSRLGMFQKRAEQVRWFADTDNTSYPWEVNKPFAFCLNQFNEIYKGLFILRMASCHAFRFLFNGWRFEKACNERESRSDWRAGRSSTLCPFNVWGNVSGSLCLCPHQAVCGSSVRGTIR